MKFFLLLIIKIIKLVKIEYYNKYLGGTK